MRIVGAIVLSAMCFFVGIRCYALNPCQARNSPKTGENPLTAAEQVHRLLLHTPREDWRQFWAGDVETVLRCGSRQDSDDFFATLYNTLAQVGGTVLEADQNSIRVIVNDGIDGHLGTFLFIFDGPLDVTPRQGDKVVISGRYSSYNREPLLIKMTNSSFDHVQ